MVSSWQTASLIQVVLILVGVASLYYFLVVWRPRPSELRLGKGSELVPMTDAHRVVLKAWTAQFEKTLGGAALGALVFMNGVGVFVGLRVPDPTLVILMLSVTGTATAAFISYYARLMMGRSADDLIGGHVVRTVGPIRVSGYGEQRKLTTVDNSFYITEAVESALKEVDTATIEYAPTAHTVMQIWDAKRRSIYCDEKYIPTTNLPPRAGG